MIRFVFALILISVFSGMVQADQNGVLVSYSYHNQIYGSVVAISSTGAVKILEHTCCPPHSDTSDTVLKPDVIQNIVQAIAAAKSGQLVIQPGSATSMGSLSGDFVGYDEQGQEVVLERIERNPTVGQPDKVSFNTSIAAKNIKDLVDALVTTKMPSLFLITLPKHPVPTGPELQQ